MGGAHGSVQCRPSTWGATLGVPSPGSYRQGRGGPLSPCPCLRQLTDHMEYRINLEMRRTICLKMEVNNCSFQEGELYKEKCQRLRLPRHLVPALAFQRRAGKQNRTTKG